MVSILDILQLIAVGNQRGGIDLAGFNERKDFGAVAAVDAAGFEGQVFAIHIWQRQGLGFVVESHHGDNGIGSGAFPGQASAIHEL